MGVGYRLRPKQRAMARLLTQAAVCPFYSLLVLSRSQVSEGQSGCYSPAERIERAQSHRGVKRLDRWARPVAKAGDIPTSPPRERGVGVQLEGAVDTS